MIGPRVAARWKAFQQVDECVILVCKFPDRREERMRFSERVKRAYLPEMTALGMLPPVAAFGRIYGSYGLALPSAKPAPYAGDPQSLFDLGIGKYLPTHPAIVEAAVNALRAGKTRYIGVPELRVAIARKYADECHVTIDPASEVKTLSGARMGVSLTFLALVDAGDPVVIPDPDFIGLTHMAAALGAKIIRPSTLDGASGRVTPDVRSVIDAIRPGTRLVAFTNPCNPSGHVWQRDELAAVATAAKAAGAVVLVNELYDRMVFGDNRHVSYLEVGDRDNLIVVGGTAKVYNMTGFGCGWLISSRDVVAQLTDVHFLMSQASPDSPSQHAALGALTPPVRDEAALQGLAVLERNAHATCAALDGWTGCKCPMPKGGQFAYPYVGGDDVDYAERLKAEVGVCVVPGSSAGPSGRGHLRITLGNPEAYQREGLERMREGMARIAKSRST
jgi:aspartate/methionine/tyrosine aminotransferase